MKVPSSGRNGYKLKAPSSAIQKVLAQRSAPPLGQELAVWAERNGLAGLDLAACDDDEIRGLSVELLKERGVSNELAVRLISKINGVVSRPRWLRADLRTLLLQMLQRDHELRLSDEVQARYARCGDDGNGKERVTGAVQRQVATEAGFGVRGVREGVDLLQSAMALFPDDAAMRASAFYLYNNIHVRCPIECGSLVPKNLPLHELVAPFGGATRQRSLAEIFSQAPLTVLCAGSATWPPFRHDAPLVIRAARRAVCQRVQWIVVYICEAHASDVWPLKFSHERPKPRTLAERAAYAHECADELGFASAGVRVLCDAMDDSFNAAFGAWPTSYFLVDQSGTLLLTGQAAEDEYAYDLRPFISGVQRAARSIEA